MRAGNSSEGRPASSSSKTVTSRDKLEAAGRSLVSNLMAPLRVPERALSALDSLAGSGRELAAMRSELIRVREQTEPLAGLMPAVERIIEQTQAVPGVLVSVERIEEQAKPLAELLPALQRVEDRLGSRLDSLEHLIVALEGEESHLNTNIGKLVDELASMHATVDGLKGAVERITDRLPDPSHGPVDKARELLTGKGGSASAGRG